MCPSLLKRNTIKRPNVHLVNYCYFHFCFWFLEISNKTIKQLMADIIPTISPDLPPASASNIITLIFFKTLISLSLWLQQVLIMTFLLLCKSSQRPNLVKLKFGDCFVRSGIVSFKMLRITLDLLHARLTYNKYIMFSQAFSELRHYELDPR